MNELISRQALIEALSVGSSGDWNQNCYPCKKVLETINSVPVVEDLPKSFRIGSDTIRGTVIICGVDGEDLADIPIDFKQWKYYLQAWGNTI